MNELETLSRNAIQVGDSAEEAPHRQKMLGLLQHVPNLVDAILRVSPSDTFRVVMSGQNAHMFHQGAQGFYPAVLRAADGRILEHVHLVQVGGDLLLGLPNLVMAVAMANVAHRLALIDAKLEYVTKLLTITQRGRLQGALVALSMARHLSVFSERRSQTLSACRDLAQEICASMGHLRALVDKMPEARTKLFDGLLGTGFAKAERAFRDMQDEVEVIAHATRLLLQALSSLDEPNASRDVLRSLVARLHEAGLPDAIRKARLLPAKSGQPPPEAFLDQFRDGVALLDSATATGGSGTGLHLSMDFQPKELCHA